MIIAFLGEEQMTQTESGRLEEVKTKRTNITTTSSFLTQQRRIGAKPASLSRHGSALWGTVDASLPPVGGATDV